MLSAARCGQNAADSHPAMKKKPAAARHAKRRPFPGGGLFHKIKTLIESAPGGSPGADDTGLRLDEATEDRYSYNPMAGDLE